MGTMDVERIDPAASGTSPTLDRRQFLKLAGAGIVVCFVIGDWPLADALAQRPEPPTDFNAFLRIGEDGRVTVFTGKIEMGQGVMTSLAQMAAEELAVPIGSIEMVMGDTQTCPFDMGTFGSMSTRFFGPALRGAAAEARAVLLDLAAERLGVPRERLAVADGVVSVAGDPARRVSFGQLAQGRRIERHASGKPALRPFAEFTVSGRSIERLDARAKVTGEAKYAADLRLPGLLHARLLRPPAHGATPKRVDTSAAAALAGVVVVQRGDLVAVLHEDPEQAERALAAVHAEFDVPAATVDTDTIFDHLVRTAPAPEARDRRGDLAAGEQACVSRFEHRYECDYGAHAPLEPHAALARIEGGKATVWASTQTPFATHKEVADALGLGLEQVRVVTPFVGGGFGGKSSPSRQSVEAARLAQITGRPVLVAWTRAEEFFYDAFRPAAVVKLRSGLDAAGRIALWDDQIYAAGTRGSEMFYDAANQLVRAYGEWGRDAGGMHPFATGPWRAPGANLNAFARESQIDLMAAQAKADPLEFRLARTSDLRLQRVLREAAARFGWTRAAAPSGRGCGLACAVDAGTYVAMCAEVEVDRASGRVRVERLVAAQDMGQVVNPDGARMQMEGSMTMGLGYALSEVVRFRGGEILERNFGTYELPRFSSLPALEAVLVKNDELAPQGGGEPAIVPVGASIANAIFDATGARVFRMPMTPERVRKAITGS